MKERSGNIPQKLTQYNKNTPEACEFPYHLVPTMLFVCHYHTTPKPLETWTLECLLMALLMHRESIKNNMGCAVKNIEIIPGKVIKN
jgi:hypothetical protein